MNRDLKGKPFAEAAEVQRESLESLDGISIEDFRQCFQQLERRWVAAPNHRGMYFEITKFSNLHIHLKYTF
jgi:hypothetical protein